MPNRLITLILLLVVLGAFGGLFTAEQIAFPGGQPLTGWFDRIILLADTAEWAEAEQLSHRLLTVWERKKHWITLNYAEADISLFESAIRRMDRAARVRNRLETTSSAAEGKGLWQNFRSWIPGP